jgi:hypothetical protein
MRFAAVVVVAAGLALSVPRLHAVELVWPKLPECDGAVMIPAQEWLISYAEGFPVGRFEASTK